ncbi:Target of rapamycin complex 1 subunit kog1 [Sporothrix epigloea]|uniref:Target of rapamycin complex 1 subunit kog1 n=1 Tax=Sporothrix epigloea TaxID=1892477 RepID=A0ABP0DXR4_9PEZI
MPSRTDSRSAPSTVVAMRSSSALANPVNPHGSHLNHFARTSATMAPPQASSPSALTADPSELVTQPAATNNSSGDQSRRSSFGGSSGIVMQSNAKQPRLVAASAQNDEADTTVSPNLQQQQQLRQAGIDRPGHSRNVSRISIGRSGPTKPALQRSKSDFVRPVEENTDMMNSSGELNRWGARHGFEDHYQSEDIISQLASNWYMYFTDKRHETNGRAKEPALELQDWRMRDRLKTVSAVIAVCLNIGVEPPDQLRTSPGARLEAWQDTTVPPVRKALENIGKALITQYEALALRPRYKHYLDPSVEETKKFCISLRRNAKDERVLLHYNGHGVPKPTASGEIWVFNKNYTQYIPVSLYDLQQWLQAPTIFVWDCSEAGNILSNYHRFVEKHEQEETDAALANPNCEKMNFRPYIHLAACATKENLPTNPLIPADVFSSCLTTPMEMALWFFVQQNPLKTALTPERAKKLPGRLQDRRTPLGELNWIFTAITDTIAWTTLPRQLFRKFFRQDLLVAALFRNFLLAQRIMSVYNCHPQSYPELPDTRQHPLWASWDLAVDQTLDQLPMLERKEAGDIDYEYCNSTFFADQLTAFEKYLTRGDAMQKKPPDQLPVVLQVLLSQQHRVRALILLGRFLDLGPWAVQLALSIGIFPYVLKLLQSATSELKPVMVFIWTRVLAVDISCQQDLIKDSGYNYFSSILKPAEGLPVTNTDEHKAMCAFILAMLCKNYKPGQTVCNQTDIMTSCLIHLRNEENSLLRQWSCLCLSQLWQDLPEAKWRGIRENAPARLSPLAQDKVCEVRASMIYAMTTLLGIPDLTDEVARVEESIAWTLMDMANDGSALVRRELLVFMSQFVLRYENKFLVAVYEHLLEEKEYLLFPPFETAAASHKVGLHYVRPEHRNRDGSVKESAQGLSYNTIFTAYWKHILIMSVDPHPEVQSHATMIVDYLHETLLSSEIGSQAQSIVEEIHRKHRRLLRNSAVPGLRNSTSLTGAGAMGGINGDSNDIGGFASGVNGSGSGAVTADGTYPPPSPGLLRRTVSTLFSPFFGTDVLSANNASAAVPPPGSSHGNESASHTLPGVLRSAQTLQNGSGRARGLGVALDRAAAPPEDSERESTTSPYNVAKEPVSAGFEHRSADQAPKLPLPSTLLDWSTEYFREPQMRLMEAEEPGSTEYNERLWRRARNEGTLRDTQPQKQYAGSHKWTNQLGIINNGSQPSRMAFHQFEDHLAVADDSNTIQLWDWKGMEKLSRFSNGNPPGSRISDMKFINEDDQALLMAGSSDGVLRVYRNYDSYSKVELATSWRALTDMVPSNVNSGMVFDWQQVSGQVLVAGDVRTIRVWNAGSEACVADIPARSGSCVTSLTSDQMTGNIFVAGFGDGAVRVFDLRVRSQDAMVRKWKDDSDRVWIKSVHMQRGGQRELLSAARDGKVRLWDIRSDNPLQTIQTTTQTLRTASTHEHLPVFAVGTSSRMVKVFNLDGRELSRIEPYSGFLQSWSAPIAATAFHPHKMTLGCAARGDSHINLFSPSEERAFD